MRTILPAPKNPVLRKKATNIPIVDITSVRIRSLIADMKKLLSREEHGVALAAPQVGEALRLFIVSGRALSRGARSAPDEPPPSEVTPHSTEPDRVYINPVLTKLSRARKEKHEGCLSIRGKWGTVRRAEKATIEAYDERGRKFVRGASHFLAHIFQHEMDHLEGILYIDKATHVYDDKESKQ